MNIVGKAIRWHNLDKEIQASSFKWIEKRKDLNVNSENKSTVPLSSCFSGDMGENTSNGEGFTYNTVFKRDNNV